MRIVLLAVLLYACDAGAPGAPQYETAGDTYDLEFLTDDEPKPSDVAYFVSRGYERPLLVAIMLDTSSPPPRELTIRDWAETYDGIPVHSSVLSVQQGRWRTRFHTRVHEPELPVRARMIPEVLARAKARARATTPSRLVYVERFALRRVGPGETGADHVLVVDHFDLVYEYEQGDATVQVDAYTGTVERFSHWID